MSSTARVHRLTRRDWFRTSAAAAAGLAVMDLAVRPARAARWANEKLQIASIGVGGRGHANTHAMSGEAIVAICDVDRNHLEAAGRDFPDARRYTDLRELLDAEADLDAVIVSTPDHTHALPTIVALQRNLHVYCEKPLTWSVREARIIADLVADRDVVTQMGTGGQSGESFLRAVEAVQAGAIGTVREAHVWTDRPIWPQGQVRPTGEDPVPQSLDWDLFLGPAPQRPFRATYPDGPLQGQRVYHPFVWRGWWDFGTGALGDIAPHAMNVVFWALNLGAPQRIEAKCSEMMPETFPNWSEIRFHFPDGAHHGDFTLTWYDGGRKPPADLADANELPDNGCIFVGTEGRLYTAGPRLLPAARFADYTWPEPTQPRRPDVHQDWLTAIKEGHQAGCHFGYSAPMTEAYLLGNIALKVQQPITWDAAAFRITDCEEANAYLDRECRPGWELPV
jgi:predicted dehydrogenase